MSKTTIAEALSRTPGQTPAPVDVTEGVYDFIVSNYRTDVVGEDEKVKVTIFAKPVEVVDSDETTQEDLENVNNVRLEHFHTPKALGNAGAIISAASFLALVLNMSRSEIEELQYDQLYEMALGQRFRGAVTVEVSNKGNEYVTFTRVFAAD